MTHPVHHDDLQDEILDLRASLYTIMQQLRLYADVTIHENGNNLTVSTQCETFSAVMYHLAQQLEDAIQQADGISGARAAKKKE